MNDKYKVNTDNLIRALTIFRKYGNTSYPTVCQHDEMYVLVDPEIVSKDDIIELDLLGFDVDNESTCFKSFAYGG
jgi:hypothetical protein